MDLSYDSETAVTAEQPHILMNHLVIGMHQAEDPPGASVVKNPMPMQMWVRSLSREDLLEEEMATHSSILAWRIPWIDEAGRLQPVGSQKIRHDLVTIQQMHQADYKATYMMSTRLPESPAAFCITFVCDTHLEHHSGPRSQEKNDLPCVCRKRPLPMQEVASL